MFNLQGFELDILYMSKKFKLMSSIMPERFERQEWFVHLRFEYLAFFICWTEDDSHHDLFSFVLIKPFQYLVGDTGQVDKHLFCFIVSLCRSCAIGIAIYDCQNIKQKSSSQLLQEAPTLVVCLRFSRWSIVRKINLKYTSLWK